MKRMLSFVLCAALIWNLGMPALADESAAAGDATAATATTSQFADIATAAGSGSGRSYRYTTAARDAYTTAEVELAGSVVNIRRRSKQAHYPDGIQVLVNGTAVLEHTVEWTDLNGGVYKGYDFTLDVSKLGEGAFTLKVFGMDIDQYAYTIVNKTFVKAGGECYFSKVNTASKRYNFNLLQRLTSGNAPNDFQVLLGEYGAEEHAAVLASIQQKVREVTAGCYSDQDKVMAIYRWIVQNVAYDFDLTRSGYELWIESHPDDAVRLDDPLHAFTKGYAMCYGYAKLAVLMMGYAGVDCVYIKGRRAADVNADLRSLEDLDQFNHAWNAVKVSGAWYFIDTCEDSVYAYHRTKKSDASTGYTQVNRGQVYVHAFPSLDQISQTHAALRVGAEKYGEKLADTAIPDGLVKDGDGNVSYYRDGAITLNTWLKVDGRIYYFDDIGRAAKGWQYLKGYWRYFNEDGVMVTGAQEIVDGGKVQTYRFDSDGCLTGSEEWITFEGASRYFAGREMYTGWKTMGGALYYFESTGELYTGQEAKYNAYTGEWYAFGENGVATPTQARSGAGEAASQHSG